MKTRNILASAAGAGLVLAVLAIASSPVAAKNANVSGNNGCGTQIRNFNALHIAHNEISGHSIHINMGAKKNSCQSGNAAITDVKGGANVDVHISEPKGAKEPAHIHKGGCSNPGAVFEPLSDVVNGTSHTHVNGLTVAKIKSGKYSIVVHDQHNMKKYVACGDLVM